MSFLSFADHFYDKEIMINGVKFFVKIASNELDRAKGYMGAQKVEYGNGMLLFLKKIKICLLDGKYTFAA